MAGTGYRLFAGEKVRFAVIDPSLKTLTEAVFNWTVFKDTNKITSASGVGMTRFVRKIDETGK